MRSSSFGEEGAAPGGGIPHRAAMEAPSMSTSGLTALVLPLTAVVQLGFPFGGTPGILVFPKAGCPCASADEDDNSGNGSPRIPSIDGTGDGRTG